MGTIKQVLLKQLLRDVLKMYTLIITFRLCVLYLIDFRLGIPLLLGNLLQCHVYKLEDEFFPLCLPLFSWLSLGTPEKLTQIESSLTEFQYFFGKVITFISQVTKLFVEIQ